MKLITEPDEGVAPLLSAIKKARKTIDIAIFRLDHGEIEAALKAAVAHGVKVTALIACANRGGEKNLRKLETRFLEAGIVVARSADDLIRYHDKLMIIDRRVLYMLSFNYSHLDIGHSRGFGIITHGARQVREAIKLFDADCTRSAYAPGLDTFVVSPENSRLVLSRFLKRARKQLLIYDPNIADTEMIRILRDRAKVGVEIRIIGRIRDDGKLQSKRLNGIRLHTRTIIRDRHQAFVGSQSLRPVELDSRREAGLIVREAKIIKKLLEIFESDWVSVEAGRGEGSIKEPSQSLVENDSEKAVQALTQELRPLTTTVKKAVKRVVARAGDEILEDKTVKDTVRRVLTKAVKKAVREVVQEAEKPGQ